jgi:sec-independent protein translocase protein TatC
VALFNRNNQDGDSEMSFVDHLEELRWHLIRSVIAILVCAIVLFMFIDEVSDYIILGPLDKSFFTYDWLCNFSHKLGMGDKLCLPAPNVELQSTQFGAMFTTSITIAFMGGFIIAFPYVFWEFWRFIKPALKPTEAKNTRGGVFFVTFFLILGILFGYFLLAPFTFSFLANYTLGTRHVIETKPTFDDYVSNLINITVGAGLAFQLPVISFVLTRIGLITPEFLKKYRKFSYLALVIIAAIITPSPDWMSQMIVVVPLVILYEFSIFVSARAFKKNKLKEAKEWS